jgi:phage host-nuclease inhibitor protein Gam
MLMDNERVILAIGRIERALSRIESAASVTKTDADPALEARHEALKAEMKQAIRTIDGLIERQEH